MAFNSGLRHHTLRAKDLLAFYDGVFAVAITTLAASIPGAIGALDRETDLLAGMATYLLVAATVGLYWFKMRRLIVIDRHIQALQIILTGLLLTSVVLIPKMAGLVLRHGVGMGNLLLWSYSQVVNTLCLSLLLIVNLLCLLYALSLRRRPNHRYRHGELLTGIVNTQQWTFSINVILLCMELFFSWFDTEYLYLVPLVLLIEEILLARIFLR